MHHKGKTALFSLVQAREFSKVLIKYKIFKLENKDVFRFLKLKYYRDHDGERSELYIRSYRPIKKIALSVSY